jgi:integrase
MKDNFIALTDSKIQALNPTTCPRREIGDKLIPGLRIRIGVNGNNSFILRKRLGSKLLNVTLGRHSPQYGIAEARKHARSLLVDIECGKDPRQRNKRQTALQGRFGDLWELYLQRAVRGQKRSAREIERYGKKYILPHFENRLVEAITRSEITRFVDDIVWRNPTKPTPRAGLSSYQFLSAFYTWLLPMFDNIPANPCRDAGRPRLPKPRERFLTNDEIKIFWQACEVLGWPFGPGFKLLLLTGQRRGEVFGAERAEIEGDLWTIPSERAKNGKAHLVPLTQAAIELLDTLPRLNSSTKLFPVAGNPDSSVNGFSKGHPRLLREMAKIADVAQYPHFTIHDIRRTVATGMQRLKVPMPVTEAVLNHVSGSRSGIAAVYQRHDYFDEKREALEKWAAEVSRIICL